MLCVVGLMALSAMHGEMVAVAATAKYTVNHWQQNIENDDYTKKATASKTGTVGNSVTAATNTYPGFVTPTKQKFTLNGDTTINYYYDRKKYSVAFEVNGNSMQDLLRYEAIPTFTGSTDKDPDVDSTYTFAGWLSSVDGQVYATSAIPAVTEAVKYTAQYSKAIRQYTVRFLVDGYEQDAKLVDYNQIPVYSGSIPQKHQQHSGYPTEVYTFTKWLNSADGKTYATDALPTVKGDQEYNALFDVEINDVICSNSLPYIWVLDGKEYQLNAAGNTTRTFNDGKSTALMHLQVNAVSYKTDSVASICSGESFYFGGRQLTQKGTYHDTLFAANHKGCDSIIVLTLTVNPTPTMAITGVEYVGKNGHVDQVIVSYDVTAAAQFDYTINDKEVKNESVNSKHAFTLDVKDLVRGRNVITAKAKTATCESTTTQFTFDVQYQHPQEIVYIVGKTDKTIYDTHITEAGLYHNEYYKVEGSKLCFYEVDLDVQDIKIFEKDHSNTVTVKAENIAADGYVHYCDRSIDQNITLPWGTFRIEAVADTGKTEMEVEYHGVGNNGDWYDGKVFVTYKTAKVLFRDTVLVVSHPEEFPIEFQGKQYGMPEDFQPNKAWESKIGQYEPVCINTSLEAEKSQLPPHPAPHRAGAAVPVDLVYNVVVRYTPAASQTTIIELGICKGDTLRYNGLDITKTGIYYDTLKNQVGADSIIMLIVNEYQTYDFHEYKTLHNNESWVWEGHKNAQTGADWEVSETGLYVDAHKTANGCDSVYTLHVTKVPMWVVNTDSVVCENDLPIEWRGRLLYEDTDITDDIHYGVDADTTYTLHLKVNKVARHYIEQKICQNETYTLNGVEYTKPGLYIDTLTTMNGCDSIITLHLTKSSVAMVEEEKVLNGSSSYEWHGQLRDRTGIYYDSIKSEVDGCDSIIYKLTLTINPSYVIDEEVKVCQNELPYPWRGKDYYNTGIFEELLKTHQGADSLLRLHLTVLEPKQTTLNVTLCEGDTFKLADHTWTWDNAGLNSITLKTAEGCDSVVNIIINRGNSYHYSETHTLYSDETYEWHGQIITQPGTYYDEQKSTTGCDSIYELVVTRTQTVETHTYDTICYSQTPYEWEWKAGEKRLIYTSGEYTEADYVGESLKNIHILHLTVNECPITERTVYICAGEEYDFFGTQLSTDTTCQHKLMTVHGCDSTIILHLNVMTGFEHHEEIAISDTELPYEWHGQQLMGSGVYKAAFKTMYDACDSVYTLKLTVYPTYRFDTTVTICESEAPLKWRGDEYSTTGEYWKYYQTAAGKRDSIYHLHLTVNKVKNTIVHVGFCEGDSYITGKGEVITEPTTYNDTIHTEFGCDSIITYVVNKWQNYHIEQTGYFNGATYTWRGKTFDHAGIYYDSLKTVNGCDSIYRLTLKLNPSYKYEEEETICKSETPYKWHGQQLYTSGTYYDRQTTMLGNDSVYTLTLTVKETKVTQKRIDLCHGEYYIYNDEKLTKTTVYEDTLKTIDGCDSITRYVVDFAPLQFRETKATICEGGGYNWQHGDKLTNVSKQGIYKDTVRNVRGCDSIIYTLKLTLAPSFKQVETDTICQNEALTYSYMGLYLTEYQRKPGEQIIKKEYKNIDGCDSIYEMHVWVRAQEMTTELPIDLCEGESYTTINGKVLNSNCEWNDTISGKTCCDSILHYVVSIHPKYEFTENVALCGSDVHAWEGEQITQAGVYTKTYQSKYGCDSVRILVATKAPEYHFADEVKVTNDMLPYVYHEQVFATPGEHTVSYATKAGCDSTYTLHLTVLPWRVSEEAVLYLCGDETITINGVTYSEAGHYSQKIVRAGESIADSIYRFELKKAPVFKAYDGVTVCESEFENGVVYHYYNSDHSQVFDITEKADKVYDITFKSLDCGCDSIIELHFHYMPTKTVKRVINVCEGDYYLFNGIKYTTTSSFSDTLKTIDGCDSITYYQLNFVPNPEHFEADTMPANGQYVWKGHKNDTIITRSGLYFDYIPSPNGCGTKYKLQLFEPSTSYEVENKEICVNQTIEWHGQIINENGLYCDTVTSMIDGTDSIYILNLTTLPVDTVKITQQLCDGEKLTLTINGEEKEYTKTGFYSPFDNGNCGTQYLIDLTVNPKYTFPTEEIQICSNEVPYVWRGKHYYRTGLYYDSLQTAKTYCDSVYSLNLKVWEPAVKDTTIDLCEGDFEYIAGKKVSQPGVYDDSLYTVHGCDSVVRYRVNLHKNYYDTTSYVLCAGDSYQWHEQTITGPGTYKNTRESKYGCDSIFVLHVSQAPTYSHKKVVTIDPDSLPYQWQGNEYWYSGTYTDEHKTAMGCDSVYELELTVIDHISKDSLIYFCAGSTIYINNKPYYAEGQYSQKIRRPDQNVVDSIFRFTLKKAPTYMSYDSIVVCDSEFENGGIVYIYKNQINGQSFNITEKKDSVYQFHFESAYGCDSIVELHFGYRPVKIANRVIEICEGDYYQFRGKKYTSTCTISDTLKTIDGCDSITRYHLNVKESPTYIETDTIDNNSSYVVWRGHKNDTIITKPGLYTDRLIGPNGCDITYKLIVFKREGIANSETVTICENQKPYIWESHNMSFNQSGIYFDSLTSKVDGSDSIFVLNLTILPTDTVWEERQICQGETIEFGGKELNSAGRYTYMDPTGCGTFHILDLIVNKKYEYTEKKQICESDAPYLWRGQECWTTNSYTDSYTTINGCDSVYTLELTVWPTPAPTLINKTLCHGDFLDIHGKHITAAGLYDDTLRTEHGCDSIVRYNIQYTTYQQKYDSASINYGESYTWQANQQAYHESGDYEYIVKSKVNLSCDSIVYHLHLIVDNFVKLNICQGDEFQFRGQSYIIKENTIFTDTLYDDHGNKTVQRYILNVWPSYHFIEYRSLCGNEYMEWHGQHLHQGGVYFDRQTTTHGCDSIYEIHITVDSIYNQITDTLVTPEELPFTWRGRRFWVETEVVDSFRTVAGCDSLFTLNLRMCNKYNTPIDTFQMCKGTSVIVSGHEYTQGGLYKLQYASATSGNHPDSIYRFYIKELEGYYAYDSIRVRESDFTNGIVYNYKGLLNITSKKDSVYKIKTSTEQGCDSIIELHFGVLRAKYETVSMNVCAGSLVWYNNRWNRVDESGIVEDKLYTSQGGDSIVTIIINIIEKPMTEHEILLCNNDTFNIGRVGGKNPLLITEPGIYLDTLTSRDGCDSIIKYIANRAESYFIERYDSIAKGGTYEWHGLLISQPGVYWDSAHTVYGCDSIYKLTLTCITQAQFTYNVKLCSGESIILRDDNGKPYVVTKPGVYYEKLWSIESGEQDSVIRYIVNVALNYTINDTVIIERGESYSWYGKTLTAAGDYSYESKTTDGCDSIVNLHLIIDNTYRSDTAVTICYEDRPFRWRGMQFYESGIYMDSIHMDAVGDSVFKLNLTVHPKIEMTLVEAKLCYGDVLYVRDQKIDKAGTYYDTLTSKITGCDSVIQYIVNEYPTFQYEETRIMCNGSSVTWRNKVYTKEGIYWDSLRTVEGCDSVFKLTVINTNSYALDTTIVWCWDDLPYRHYNGKFTTYYDVKDFPQGSRTFIDTLIASNGCDSITRTHVILTNKCNRNLDTIYFCQGQQYPNVIGGQKIDHEGVYYFSEWTFDGYSAKLDSVHRAIAIEARTYEFYESYTACQGDMTEVHEGFIPGAYPTGQRTITVNYKTIHGCDSIYTIDLTVNPSYKNFVSDWQMRDIDVNQLTFTDHDGNPVTFTIDGSLYPAGQNNINLVTYTSTGCEESFNLTLTVVPTTYQTDSVRICYLNLPYTYQDFDEQSGTMVSKEAYAAGTYQAHNYRPGGNVSTVTTITLYVDSETTLETAQANPACQQETYDTPKMVIDFTYSGSKPTEYDLVFSRNAISEGFVNVFGGKVTKSDQIDVTWPTYKQTTQYVRPDDYYVDLTLTNGACGTSAQNTMRLPFRVLYPAWITESLFDHTIAILNENHNGGGYVFSNYSWFVNGNYVPTNLSYIYDPNGTIIQSGDIYYVELTRMGENYSIPTCEKVYTPDQPVTGSPRLLKPATNNQSAEPIRMKAYGDGTYYIYSHTGQFCGSGEFHEGEQDILLPEVKGCYLIRMQQNDGESNTEKALLF